VELLKEEAKHAPSVMKSQNRNGHWQVNANEDSIESQTKTRKFLDKLKPRE
jgi:hypothetical protein